MNKITVSIVIVNFNTKDLLLNCIKSIYEKTKEVSFEIIVVDNDSIDGTENAITNSFPEVLFIQSGSNIGFGRANNLGVNYSKGDYILFLNSDTILLNNSLKVFVDFYIANHSSLMIGAVGGELLKVDCVSRNHSSQYFPRFIDEIKTLLNALIVKLFGKSFFNFKDELVLGEDESFKKVEYVTGADLFISKDLFCEFNGFDEDFFMYFEETDLQKRLFKSYNNYLISGTKIVHYEGASISNVKSGNRIYMLDQSRFKYYKKHNNYFFYFLFRILYFFLTIPLLFDYRIKFNKRIQLFLLRIGFDV